LISLEKLTCKGSGVSVPTDGATGCATIARVNVAGFATPEANPVTVNMPTVVLAVSTGAVAMVAVNWNEPVCEFAVRLGEVAMPAASLVTVAEPPKVTLAPLAGAVKVTCAPLIRLPNESATKALSRPL
jgi:hypothetical protein